MNSGFSIGIASLLALAALCSAEEVTLPVWPGDAPGEENFKAPAELPKQRGDGVYRIALVEKPEIAVYRPDKPNGAAVVICPGGAYNILAYDKEGTEIAEWLNTLGVTAIVLKYRVPRRDPIDPEAKPLQDLQRAIRLVRKRADEWGIDAKKVGVLGFSAGGNLAVMAATRWGEKTYPAMDDADELSCRPDFLIPIYPAYLGEKKSDPPRLSKKVKVTGKTPPMFIAITQDDADRAVYASLLFVALKRAGVKGELHIYSVGGHGYGMRPSKNPVHTWPKRCEEWMRAEGILGE